MISKYFDDFNKKIVKKRKTAANKKTKSAAKKTSGKGSSAGKKTTEQIKFDLKLFSEKLNNIIPAFLQIASVKPIDSSGFSPSGADLIAYKPFCRDIIEIMDGYIPYESVYGTYHIEPALNKSDLGSLLGRVAAVKRLNTSAENPEGGKSVVVPAFIVIGETSFSIRDIKNEIINFYIEKSVNSDFEFDILIIWNKGIIVKNWREKRSFIALETGEDTMLWFFILMNEYLDVEKNVEPDFRQYLKKDITYKEY